MPNSSASQVITAWEAFFLTVGGRFGNIMAKAIAPSLPAPPTQPSPMPTPSVTVAITSMTTLACITATPGIIAPSGEDLSPPTIPPTWTPNPSMV
jgi:hypothetical protein